MPLSPHQMRENLARRFAETYEADLRATAEMKARLPRAVELICRELGPRRVVLFGSLAVDLFFAADSDIDLAVSGLGAGPPESLRAELRRLFGRKVDLVDPEWVARAFGEAIERDGVVLHDPEG